MNTYALIGKRIKEYRKRAGLTQQNLAELMNWSPSFVSRLETGTSMTSIQGLVDLSVVLNTSVDSFFIDFSDPDKSKNLLQTPRLRELLLKLYQMDEQHRNYMLDNIELFISSFGK